MEEIQGADNVPRENPELWVQLGAKTRSTNLAILETVQELKREMARLREDNAQLTVEQERILNAVRMARARLMGRLPCRVRAPNRFGE